jgi:hypothetical protein
VTAGRLFAIAVIFICSTVAWFVLGTSVMQRTGEFDGRLQQEVSLLWGGRHDQHAPESWIERQREVTEEVEEKTEGGASVKRRVKRTVTDNLAVTPASSRIGVDLTLAHRRKGLLWYDTYGVTFTGAYQMRNPDPGPRMLCVRFPFPSTTGIYDQFVFEVAGQKAGPTADLAKGPTSCTSVDAGGTVGVKVGYRSRGLDTWIYSFAENGVSEVQNFELVMRTDFDKVDFPVGTISPVENVHDGSGRRLRWRFGSLVTGQKIGMDLPNRINPGPLAARVTFFAPVSLLFFLTVMVMLGVVKGQSLHPMHYFFLSAAFFAHHLLLAYLVDHLQVHASFAIASAVSVLLVVSYLRVVAGPRFALLRAGVAQTVFLVAFSYAFFFEGFTGLTVTIGAILTLFVLMQMTARVDWNVTLARPVRRSGATST